MQEKNSISILVPYKIEGQKVLVYMQMRSQDQKLSGHFGFFGGHAEKNENPEQTLEREIKEELNIKLISSNYSLFNRYEFLRSFKYVFLFEPRSDWEDLVVVSEGKYGKWLDTREAVKLENIIFEDKVVLDNVQKVLLQAQKAK